jgi:hypothetical protein
MERRNSKEEVIQRTDLVKPGTLEATSIENREIKTRNPYNQSTLVYGLYSDLMRPEALEVAQGE